MALTEADLGEEYNMASYPKQSPENMDFVTLLLV